MFFFCNLMQSHVSSVVWLSTAWTRANFNWSFSVWIYLTVISGDHSKVLCPKCEWYLTTFCKVENISETLGTLICLPRKVFTFENHFGRSGASSCQVNNVRGSSLLFGQVELFVFVPETFESELVTGFDLDLIQLVQYWNNIWLPWYHLAEGMKEVRRCFPLPLPPEYTEIQAGCKIRVEMLLFWKGGK